VEETGVPGENNRPAASHWQIYDIMLYRVHLAMIEVRTHNLSGGTDYVVICEWRHSQLRLESVIFYSNIEIISQLLQYYDWNI
jgi:hypothetical protein